MSPNNISNEHHDEPPRIISMINFHLLKYIVQFKNASQTNGIYYHFIHIICSVWGKYIYTRSVVYCTNAIQNIKFSRPSIENAKGGTLECNVIFEHVHQHFMVPQ